MSGFDFNNAERGLGNFELIPNGTIAPMILTIRPGAAGPEGWLTQSKSSDAMMLDCELAITGGQYKGRRIWQNLVVSGGKVDENGASKAGNITRSTLRAILESARGIRSDDESDAAKKARIVSGFGDFSGLEFVGKIGIEKGNAGYEDKNRLLAAIGPENKDYAAAKALGTGSAPSPSSSSSGGGAAPKPSTGGVPAWAQ